jgi:hypothetical protein
MAQRDKRQFVRDMKLGIVTGLSFALICAVFATLRFLLGGPAAFAKTELSYGQVMLLYLLGGIGAGILIGVLRPLRRTSWGSFMIGFCAVLPLAAMAALLVFARRDWYPLAVISIVMSALLAGGLGAALFGETKGWTS